MSTRCKQVRPLVEALEVRTLLSASSFDLPYAAAAPLLADAPTAMTLSASAPDQGSNTLGLRRFRLAPVLAAATAARVQLPLPGRSDLPASYFLNIIKGLDLRAGPTVLSQDGLQNVVPAVDTPAATSQSVVTGHTVGLSVLGSDSAGENTLTYTWAVASGPVGAFVDFSANGSNAAKISSATFHQAGQYTFQVTISDGSAAVFSSVGVMVDQSLTSLTVTPAAQSSALRGQVSLNAAGYDQFGAMMATAPTVTWSTTLGSVSDSVFNSGTTPGSALITAHSGDLSASTTIAVVDAPPVLTAPASANLTSNTTLNLSALATDDSGAAGLTYTWTTLSAPSGAAATFTNNGSSSSNINVTVNRAGTYGFRVTISDGAATVTSTVGVTVNQVVSSLTLTPATHSTALQGQVGLNVTAADQFGIAMAVPTLTWSATLGSVSGSVFYSGTTAGTALLTAHVGGASASTSIVVNNTAPVLTTSAGAVLTSNSSARLSALATDDGGAAGLIYTWSTISAPTGATASFNTNGSSSSSNVNVTVNHAGTYGFRVTISDGTFALVSNVNVTVNAALSTLAVNPATANLALNDTLQLAASAYDQFGQPMSTSGLSWSLGSGSVGTLSSSGFYTGSGSGSAVASAHLGALTASSQITVGQAPVNVSTRSMVSFTEVVITGTSGNDSIYVAQSGSTLTIVANGQTTTLTGTFGDMVIHGGDGNDSITVDSSVSINTLLYGDNGGDTIAAGGRGSYNAVVTLGDGADTITGNGINTNFWADTGDTVNASATESNGGYVHLISSFYQPWSSVPSNVDYISTSLAGQNFRDPAAGQGYVRLTNRSLFGTGAVMQDVNQGQVGDCFYLAALEGLANGQPQRIEQSAVDLGDGTYAVTMLARGNWITLRVDGDLPGSGSSLYYAHPGSSGDIWAPIMEKAYAFARSGANSYSSIDYGSVVEGIQTFGLSYSGISYSSDDATIYAWATAQLTQGHVIIIGTGTNIAAGAPLIGGHAYALVSVQMVNGTLNLTFRNPWGFDGIGNDGNTSDGLVTLTSSQLRANYLSLFGSTA